MNQIYKGEFLSISYEEENTLFCINWKKSPINVSAFKFEMLAYTNLYKIHKPKLALWFQKQFKLVLTNEDHEWIEENVNIPCFNYGNEKCAFIVSQDVLAHISVIESFDSLNSCIVPKHFVNEKEARAWFETKENKPESIFENSNFLFDGTDENGDVILKVSSGNIKQTFKVVSKLLNEEQLNEEFELKKKLLTKRENDILELVYLGEKHQVIAEKLFLSIHTVRTHLKNSKTKLNFKKETDFVKFLKTIYS
jgi:DNA-binding CsgD family transcriptional regulator